ncbi:MAG: sigma 54-interacting transcriptional regulator, partial [Bacillota bacterium]
RKFAVVDCHVLLIGETGTGKEMFAQSIHRESSRSQKDFVAINCASMPETLIESMLFGTVKGSFTGSENKAGLFEEANGGTLFLDELNSMSLAMQSNLLRIVQEGVYRRVGGSRDLKTDVRIISSSNEDPYLLIEEGRMRRDLFYRLSSVQIQIPPLRDRLEDLGQLVERYIQLKRRQFAKEIDYVTPEVLSLFRAYRWPGNVRELFHVLDYAMNMMDNGVIDEACLPPHFIERLSPDKAPCGADIDVIHSELEDIIGDYESRVLKKVLQHYGNNISHAAASLGISRQRLSYRIRKYGIVL